MNHQLTRDNLIAAIEFMLNGLQTDELNQLSDDVSNSLKKYEKNKQLEETQSPKNRIRSITEEDTVNGLIFLEALIDATILVREQK